MFNEEIQKVGDAIGLKGKFLVDWGFDHIATAFTQRNFDIERAVEMLNIAAKYIREQYPDGTVFYDDTDCDGYCVADDCEIAATALIDIQ